MLRQVVAAVDRGGSPLVVRARGEHRVTTLELFFDLLFVFAFTQVTHLVVEQPDAIGLIHAVTVLGLLWWTWESFVWLCNEARADRGVIRIGLIVAMVLVLVIALTISQAFEQSSSSRGAALAIAVGYTAVKIVHAACFLVAAGDSPLRRQLVISLVASVMPTGTLLVVGAVVGGDAQTWLWLAAFAADVIAAYATSALGGEHLAAAGHFAERHGLIVLLALGETLLAIGTSAVGELSAPVVLVVALSLLISLALWRWYFASFADALRARLARLGGPARSHLGRDAYAYGHFPLIVGILATAVGGERLVELVGAGEGRTGWFAAAALALGPALFLLAGAAVAARASAGAIRIRISAAAFLLALVPVISLLPPAATAAAVAAALALAALADRRPGRSADFELG
nr:low temperature requirement protein A [Agromyces seonyuensis]